MYLTNFCNKMVQILRVSQFRLLWLSLTFGFVADVRRLYMDKSLWMARGEKKIGENPRIFWIESLPTRTRGFSCPQTHRLVAAGAAERAAVNGSDKGPFSRKSFPHHCSCQEMFMKSVISHQPRP